MKKIQVVALGAFVAVGALFTSCGGSVSSDASLKTENDTISYAFGASLYDQGLSMHLQQLGVISDTTGIGAYYKRQIDAEQDSSKKDSLQKVMKHKLDSTVKVNERNIAEFLKGLKESIDAPDSKSAYYAGVSVGGQISKQMFPNLINQMYGPDSKEKINSNAFIAAMATAMKKGKFAVNDPASLFQVKMQEVQAKAQARQEEELKKQYAPQIEAGQKFLDENKAKEGVVTLPDGLQYKIVKEGTGAKPAATDVVKVHYHGTLLDGTVFDSSVDRKEPATFNVSAVIKGWTEVLQLMPVGSKWQVYIPYDLAYGAQDRGTIKPFSTLIFDIELLDIEKK
ncbi:MAG: FKBP-type peptidyl-prolyl cis-trans isomerase [Dysgonomonas sp.]|jgi:FKBP-type peptidyl-prolyl cis-trans isomerase FklB|uniref:FKBP-type peptidyl-prolyl cis-trans isomerase n=1 Tax=unclassified Dysgonomonas TaxID=2630389 RepID=UPI0025BA863A|nr:MULTISPECIES: FKBP-type peptidyl-prolyl cis-trans isomerase [unclassified Dysgonomonas]MDR2001553.1 FKBP-type peptidyl-prolyl cis-trans isomerase [Prevotella sp.]HMM02556.1 FKBP-type peptidyl-prolyl cis-trans isomerase [Dysgonomonas sp.]